MRSEKARAVFWPTVATILAALILISLGTWQLDRKAWKEDLVQRLEQRSNAEPIVLDAAASLFKSGDNMEYTRIRARGRLLTDKSKFLFHAQGTAAGYHVYTPLETPNGAILMVNRGFVPEGQLAILDQGTAARKPLVDVVGRLRSPGSKATFDAPNDIQKNRWYWRDLDGMVKASFPDDRRDAYPFFLEIEPTASGQSAAEIYPRPLNSLVQLPNKHLEYAMTWYGLALTLIGVYFAFIRGRLRDLSPTKIRSSAG